MFYLHACTTFYLNACTMFYVHACTMFYLHACTMFYLHACTMFYVHACTMFYLHVCTMLTLLHYLIDPFQWLHLLRGPCLRKAQSDQLIQQSLRSTHQSLLNRFSSCLVMKRSVEYYIRNNCLHLFIYVVVAI